MTLSNFKAPIFKASGFKASTLKTSIIFAALIGSLALTGCERKETVLVPVPGPAGATGVQRAPMARAALKVTLAIPVTQAQRVILVQLAILAHPAVQAVTVKQATPLLLCLNK
jgi:hypothetical protein